MKPQLISLDESDFEASSNPQDTARNARFSPRADSRTIGKRAAQDTRSSARKQDTGLLTCLFFCNALLLRPRSVLRAERPPPDRWRRVAILLAVFVFSLSNNESCLWLFVHCKPVSKPARRKAPSRSGKFSKPSKRKISDNTEL